MSEEQRKDEETEVEGHGRRAVTDDEVADDGAPSEEDDVEGHMRRA